MEIERDTFSDTRIREIVFEGDAELGPMLFYGNNSLENITFKGDVDLDYSAFWECKKLKNINVNIDKPLKGVSFNNCPQLMTVNGISPVNDDGSLKPGYEDFIRKYFNDSDGIGFINKYVMYCVKKIVNETVTDDMTDMEKVKALHDKLCSITTYDTEDVKAEKNHVDVSVFLNDSTVCEGYSRALNLMLHEAGIESCYVNTETHAWLIVKLGDHYFHVDPTWDDGDEINYNWFMKVDNDLKDEASHAGWKIKCPSSLHDFQWTEMPACTDRMGDLNKDDIIDGRDASAILTAYARSSAGSDAGIDTVIADYDFNGIIDGRDASAVLTEYTKASVDNK